MLIKKAADIPSSEITPKSLYLNRRKFLAGAALAGAAAATGVGLREIVSPSTMALAGNKIDGIQKSPLSTTETVTPYKDVTNYNNYYEFSTEKDEPAKLAQKFRTRPWKVKIDGLVDKKQELDIDTILKMAPPEERIYRHRCVEGWSIVVPWVGFSLSELIKRANPTSKAKFVEFTTHPRSVPDARPAAQCAAVALRRGPAHGRSHASARPALLWHVRRRPAQSGWRPVCASSCPGSMVSKAPRRSCAFASPTSSR